MESILHICMGFALGCLLTWGISYDYRRMILRDWQESLREARALRLREQIQKATLTTLRAQVMRLSQMLRTCKEQSEIASAIIEAQTRLGLYNPETNAPIVELPKVTEE